MRELFPEYAGLSKKDLDSLWREATFVFDTNVLLGIHSWPEAKSNWVLREIRQKIPNRIWIPHQVALEFVKNRTTRLSDRISKIDALNKDLEKK